MTSYWFLASPYSKYPDGFEKAYQEAVTACGFLLKAGIAVYSPIVHSHPVAKMFGMDPCDLCIWLPSEKPKRDAAVGIIMLRAESWEISVGMEHERKEFHDAGKPVIWLDTGPVSDEVLQSLTAAMKKPEPDGLQTKLFHQSIADIGESMISLSMILQQGIREDNMAQRGGIACGLERAAAHVRGERYAPVVDPKHLGSSKGN